MDKTRVFKLRIKRVGKIPIQTRLPDEFIEKNKIKRGDILSFFINSHGELIIKKEN